METQQYDDEKLPHHVVNFFRMQRKEKVAGILEREGVKAMDDDEMREIEPGQNVGFYNFFK